MPLVDYLPDKGNMVGAKRSFGIWPGCRYYYVLLWLTRSSFFGIMDLLHTETFVFSLKLLSFRISVTPKRTYENPVHQ